VDCEEICGGEAGGGGGPYGVVGDLDWSGDKPYGVES
jgi:hypothetical protein